MNDPVVCTCNPDGYEPAVHTPGCPKREVSWAPKTEVPEIRLVQGDLSQSAGYEVVVNAANPRLQAGGGVDGAIHRAAGPDLQENLTWIRETVYAGRYMPTSAAFPTVGYGIAEKALVHTVGPVYPHEAAPDFEENVIRRRELLARCYVNALAVADAEPICASSVAFPAISTGAYGWPAQDAAGVAIEAVQSRELEHVQVVWFVLFDEPMLRTFQTALIGPLFQDFADGAEPRASDPVREAVGPPDVRFEQEAGRAVEAMRLAASSMAPGAAASIRLTAARLAAALQVARSHRR